jgi:hypothetical protein
MMASGEIKAFNENVKTRRVKIEPWEPTPRSGRCG